MFLLILIVVFFCIFLIIIPLESSQLTMQNTFDVSKSYVNTMLDVGKAYLDSAKGKNASLFVCF